MAHKILLTPSTPDDTLDDDGAATHILPKPMNEERRAKLRANRAAIVQDLDVEDILDEMIQENAITVDEKDRINASATCTRRGKAACFLDILERKGNKAFKIFLGALGESYSHLQTLLLSCKTVTIDSKKIYLGLTPKQKTNGSTIDDYKAITQRHSLESPTDLEKLYSEPNPTAVIIDDVEVETVESPTEFTVENRKKKTKQLRKGSTIIIDTNWTKNIQNNLGGDNIVATTTFGEYVLLHCHFVADYGDPIGEPWFFPLEISSRQAALIIQGVSEKGCFLVYRSSSRSETKPYNIALCDCFDQITHYRVHLNKNREFSLDSKRWFLTMKQLVHFYRSTSDSLTSRFRRCPRDTNIPLAPGIHFPAVLNVNHEDVKLTDRLIGNQFRKVYRAVFRQRDVIVKTCSSLTVKFPDIDDFLNEARLLSQLHAPNIIMLLGISIAPQEVYIITNLMSQGSLAHCIQEGIFSVENYARMIDMFKQLLQALMFLEKNSYIIHRDVTARNILVEDHMQVRLADFGLARWVSEDKYIADVGEKFAVRWAAPEILTKSEFSTKSDMWAAGAVLWEMFSEGKYPYEERKTLMEVAELIKGHHLLEKPKSCPDDIYDNLIFPCWFLNRELRPSAGELLNRCDELVSSFGPIYENSEPRRKSKSHEKQFSSDMSWIKHDY